MLVGTILRAKKKKTKATTHLFSMRSSKGLERMLWIATRAIFNTSVSKQTILNLACSVIHPTPDEQKQIIILLTAKQTWFIELLIQFRQFLATKTLFLRCHCLALFTRAPFGAADSSSHISLICITWLTFFLQIDWFLARRIRGFKLKWLNSAHYAKSIFFTQTDAARRSKGWCYKYALLCDCEPSPYLMS